MIRMSICAHYTWFTRPAIHLFKQTQRLKRVKSANVTERYVHIVSVAKKGYSVHRAHIQGIMSIERAFPGCCENVER